MAHEKKGAPTIKLEEERGLELIARTRDLCLGGVLQPATNEKKNARVSQQPRGQNTHKPLFPCLAPYHADALPLLLGGVDKVLDGLAVADSVDAPQARVRVRGVEGHVALRQLVLGCLARKLGRQVLTATKAAVPGANNLVVGDGGLGEEGWWKGLRGEAWAAPDFRQHTEEAIISGK